MRDIVSEDRLEAALLFLADSDDAYAEAKAHAERTEILRKRARARVFLTVDGSIAERNAQAETSGDVLEADDCYIAAVTAYEKLRARRGRAELIVDVWRTLSANQRK